MSTATCSLVTKGARLHFSQAGAGPLSVLVHGALSDYRYWAPQMQPLGERFRTVAVSLRHHHPDVQPPAATYGVRQHADELVAFLEALGTGPAHLVGHSRGAHVCVLAALRRPEMVASLVLADPAVPLENASPSEAGRPVLSEQRRVALERIAGGDIEGGLEAFIDAVSGAGVWRRLNGRRRQMARDNATTLPAQYADPGLTDPVREIAALSTPVLIVAGEKSPPPYPGIARELASRLPDARTLVLQNTSHGMNAEDANGFNAAVLSFWESLRTGSVTRA